VTTLTSDAEGRQTDKIDPGGLQTHYDFDGVGRMTQVTEGYGLASPRVTTFGYDALGRKVRTTDALGNYNAASYDALGHAVYSGEGAGSGPDVRWVSKTFNVAGDLAYEDFKFSAGGATTTFRVTFSYDAAHRLVKTQEPGDTTSPERDTETVRDLAGNVVLVLGPRANQASRNTYDADNRLTGQYQVKDTSGTGSERSNQRTWDAAGNQLTFVDPIGKATTFSYDALYRQTSVQEPLNKITTTTWDISDRVLSVTDALNRTTSFAYDDLGRRTLVIENYGLGSERRTTTVYNVNDTVGSVIDPLGFRVTYGYDALNGLQSVTDPQSNITTYSNDILGRATMTLDALGHKTGLQYDALGRVITQTSNLQLASNQQTVRYSVYDWRGQPTAVRIGTTDVGSYEYNFWGQPTKISDSTGFLRASYDGAGNAVSTHDSDTDNANYITYTYDLLNRRTQAQVYVATAQGVSASLANATYSYDDASHLTSTTDRDGRRRDFTLDDLARVTCPSRK
jgi:YD repeat-containing protein